MSDWKRSTKEVSFQDLPSAMVSAINKHIEQYNLGPILSDALICFQTDSEKEKKGLFGKAEAVHVGVVVTPRWLLWAISGTSAAMAVLSAQLRNVSVQDYAQTPLAKMVPDCGIQVSGMFTDVSENTTAFIGLGDSPAGKKFMELVIKSVQEAKK